MLVLDSSRLNEADCLPDDEFRYLFDMSGVRPKEMRSVRRIGLPRYKTLEPFFFEDDRKLALFNDFFLSRSGVNGRVEARLAYNLTSDE
jgi:hypothetical protein